MTSHAISQRPGAFSIFFLFRKGLRAGHTELLRALQGPLWPVALRQLQETASRHASRHVIGALLGCCAKHQLWRLAVAMLTALPQPNAVCFNATVSACERASAWREALELFSQARERGLANAWRLRDEGRHSMCVEYRAV